MIRVLLFGRLGELHDSDELAFEWSQTLANPRGLAAQVASGHAQLERELADPQVLVAVDQKLVDWDHPIEDGAEIAFLPPVTGG